MGNKKHQRKPDLVFYSVLVKNETRKISNNVTSFSLETLFLDKLKNKIGTGVATGTTTISSAPDSVMFLQEIYTLRFPKGTITSVIADVNGSDQNGVLRQQPAPHVFRITSGTGDYAFKNGYMIGKTINDTTGIIKIYFTKK